jgi:hypothetical protein
VSRRHKIVSLTSSPSSALPVQFSADRLLAAIWGLPALVAALFMLTMAVVTLDAGIHHPFFLLLMLASPGVIGWVGWRLGHNVIWPDRLFLTEKGLTLKTFRHERFWRWDQIADAHPGTGRLLSDVVIILNADDPGRVNFVRLGILRNARAISLGMMWQSPFGTRASVMISGVIRATLAARQCQPITAQLSG